MTLAPPSRHVVFVGLPQSPSPTNSFQILLDPASPRGSEAVMVRGCSAEKLVLFYTSKIHTTKKQTRTTSVFILFNYQLILFKTLFFTFPYNTKHIIAPITSAVTIANHTYSRPNNIFNINANGNIITS